MVTTAWATVAAGSAIDNIATATYVDSTSGIRITLTSGRVHTVVQALEGLTLDTSQTLARPPAGPVSLAHRLVNTGNVTSTYVLNLSPVAGGAFTLLNLALVLDQNGNGSVDAGETVIPNGGTLTLAPGAVATVLVSGQVPGTAVVGQSAQFLLSATSQAQGVSATNTDTINIIDGPSITVFKSATTLNPAPGDVVTFALVANNNGNATAGPVDVSIDGVVVQRLLLRDSLPANTTFVSLAPSGLSTRLYHRRGDGANQYVSVAPAADDVDGVGYALSQLVTGGQLAGSVNVRVNDNAGGTLRNTAYTDYSGSTNPGGGGASSNFSVPSNTVQLVLPALMPTIQFLEKTFAHVISQTTIGAPLYVQVVGSQCNTDISIANTIQVTLKSKLTGDVETFTAKETGPNTGLFRILPDVPTSDAQIHVVTAGNGVLEVLKDDEVIASITGCGAAGQVSTKILVDPSGVVFDSRSNSPIAGATVQLIDVSGAGNGGKPGSPASVLAADGFTPAPSSMVVGADGRFSFPLLTASTYRLVVTAPAGYAFPSALAPSRLPAGRNIDASASYGGNFTMVGNTPVTIDVPLDTAASAGLFVEKVASKSAAEIGDFVDYVVTVKNASTLTFANVRLGDSLPAGFGYVRGTARLNSVVIADPVGGAGPALAFSVGTLAPNAQAVLSYRLRLGPGAQSGDGINRAQATSGLSSSNVASAKVTIKDGGVFSNRAYLFGKVYADCNANGLQDWDEPGIPGVRILLEDGTSATTDSEGKYSLYGLLPRTHVAKVDPITLPPGATMEVLANRNAGDGDSRFVDLTNGELHKADFAIAQCTLEINDDIAARRKGAASQSETVTASKALMVATPVVAADPRTQPASGVRDALGITGAAAASGTPSAATPALRPAAASATAPADAQPAAPQTPAEHGAALEKLLPTLDPEAGFIDLKDGVALATTQATVRVKGPIGTQLRLAVNDEDVDARHVGQQSALPERGVTAWEYIGVTLRPGVNTLRLSAVDTFGNARATVSLRVRAPGDLAKIVIETPPALSANGRTPVEIVVRLFDKDGTPVAARMPVTLESSLGQWQEKDLDPQEPGLQVFIEGGVGRFALTPPGEAGQGTLRATSGKVRAEIKPTFLPDLRPMVAVGVVEGVINLRNLNPNNLTPVTSGDMFERQIQSASRSFDNGKGSVAARSALFLKGKIDGQTLLTLAYDSDKPSSQQLFRDIQPEEFYPVYGDASVRGFDAQSTGRLYVRVDRGTSYALYGDFSTQSDDPARGLTQYNRALTGLRGRYDVGPVKVEGFASYTDSTQVVDEIRANGTSGPYTLSSSNGLANSEQVHILTRDRNQPAVIIKDVPQTRFTDYEMEAYTGRLLFKSPVASLDANLNPVSIRISYEVQQNGPRYWIGGIDAKYQVTDTLNVGVVDIRDTNPQDRKTLSGVNFTLKLAEKSTLIGEVAHSEADVEGKGSARRLEYRADGETFQARVYGGKSDAAFNNPGALLDSGRAEYGAKAAYSIDQENRVVLEALRTEDTTTGGRRDGMSLQIEHSLPGNMKLEAGLRHSNETSTPALTTPLATSVGATPNRYTSVRAKLSAPVPGLDNATVYGEYEQAVDESDRKVAAVGGTYALNNGGRLYFRHEFISSLSGPYGLTSTQSQNTSVFGMDTDYMKDGHVFSEYRVADAIDNRSAEAAVGLRNLWHIADGVAVSTTAETIHPMSGAVSDKSNALTGAIEYTANPDWKASARAEVRNATSSDSWLTSAAVALKVDADWTLLSKGLLSLQTNNSVNGGAHRIMRGQIGAAYRPVYSDAWNALIRLEKNLDRDGTLGQGLDIESDSTILSAHLNYQVNRELLLSGRYGVKHTIDRSNGNDSSYTAQIIGGRATYDINARWDAGVGAFLLAGGGGTSRQMALGAEVGYLVMQNFWVSVGYNWMGFRDKELAGEDYTQRGPYMRMRFKFDEKLFNGGKPQAPVASAAQPDSGVAQ